MNKYNVARVIPRQTAHSLSATASVDLGGPPAKLTLASKSPAAFENICLDNLEELFDDLKNGSRRKYYGAIKAIDAILSSHSATMEAKLAIRYSLPGLEPKRGRLPGGNPELLRLVRDFAAQHDFSRRHCKAAEAFLAIHKDDLIARGLPSSFSTLKNLFKDEYQK